MLVRLTLLALATAIPIGAMAAPEKVAPPVADPDEKICEKVTQIGSRLSRKRICATRAEWAERRLKDRQDAEHIQRSITGSTCVAVKNNQNPIC